MENNLNKKIFEMIQDKKVSPKPRWHFVVKKIIVWIGLITSLLLSGLLLTLVLFQGGNYHLLPPHQAPLFILITISFVSLFLALSIYQVKCTKRGYKKETWKYLVLGIAATFAFGIAFFSARVHERLEYIVPARPHLLGGIATVQRYWSQPDEGLLAGEVVAMLDDGYLMFEDLQGNNHLLDPSKLTDNQRESFVRFLKVQMIGYHSDGVFHPCIVAPWELRGAKRELRPEFKQQMHLGNIDFGLGMDGVKDFNKTFKKTFEIKSEIVRSNKCQ